MKRVSTKEAENVLKRLGEHADQLEKNKYIDCPAMQKDFNTYDKESFKFEDLEVDNVKYIDESFRKDREKKEIEKIKKKNKELSYNEVEEKTDFVKYKQKIKIFGKEYNSYRDAERLSGEPKTTIRRKCFDPNETNYELLKKIPYEKDYAKQSTSIVVDDIVYTSISGKNGAKKALKKRSKTLMKFCNSEKDKNYQFYNSEKHSNLPVYNANNKNNNNNKVERSNDYSERK